MPDAAPSWPADCAALVPVFDHATAVGGVVSALRAAGARVFCVDDGSRDGSGVAAAAAGAEVITVPVNRGKGAALRAGFAAARAAGFARVLTVDADGQHPEAAWRRLLAHPVAPHLLLIGRRDMAGAPAASRFGRAFSNFWVRVACGQDPGDSQSGLRLYPLAEVLALPCRADRYQYEVEVVVRAVWAGVTVQAVDVPVIYPPDRISHFRAGADNLRFTLWFTRLIVRRLLPWPVRRVVPRPPRPCLRDLLRGGLSPALAGLGAGLGAACGVAPLPGLQTVIAVYLALRLRLNLPLVLLTANISFGPLLAFWTALAVALGLALRGGTGLVTAFRDLNHEFSGIAWADLGPALLRHLGDYLLGGAVLTVVVGVVVGVLAAGVARLLRTRPA